MHNIPRLLLSDVGGSLGHIQGKRGMASKRWLHVSSRGSSPSHQESALCWRSNRRRIALFLALYPFSHSNYTRSLTTLYPRNQAQRKEAPDQLELSSLLRVLNGMVGLYGVKVTDSEFKLFLDVVKAATSERLVRFVSLFLTSLRRTDRPSTPSESSVLLCWTAMCPISVRHNLSTSFSRPNRRW